jgi:hypothetical protein
VGLNKEKPCAFSALFLHFHLFLKVNRNILTLAPLGQDGPRGSIELSNLIYVGLEQIEVQFFEEILVENGDG